MSPFTTPETNVRIVSVDSRSPSRFFCISSGILSAGAELFAMADIASRLQRCECFCAESNTATLKRLWFHFICSVLERRICRSKLIHARSTKTSYGMFCFNYVRGYNVGETGASCNTGKVYQRACRQNCSCKLIFTHSFEHVKYNIT